MHASRIAECTDEQCLDLSHDRHAFVLDCRDLAGGCRCTDDDTVRRRA
ncbi:hypothetical protein [Nocardia exalbida]|nr:hypothetical protein [Nocardia exalbida]